LLFFSLNFGQSAPYTTPVKSASHATRPSPRATQDLFLELFLLCAYDVIKDGDFTRRWSRSFQQYPIKNCQVKSKDPNRSNNICETATFTEKTLVSHTRALCLGEMSQRYLTRRLIDGAIWTHSAVKLHVIGHGIMHNAAIYGNIGWLLLRQVV
jgi:hypothetical protein